MHISFTNFHRIRSHSTNLYFERSAGLDFSAFSTPFFIHRKGYRIVSLAYLILEGMFVVCQLRNFSIQYLWGMTTQSRTVQSLVRSGYVFKSVAVILPFSISFVSSYGVHLPLTHAFGQNHLLLSPGQTDTQEVAS